MSDKARLGKGLEAIFGENVNDVLEQIQQGTMEGFQGSRQNIPCLDVRPNPYQPRKQFDQEKLQELADSIAQHGMFTPILVRVIPNGYELIAGERRLRASIMAGKPTVEAIILDFSDEQMMEVSLVENIQREDLNIMEEAMAYQMMMERLSLTQDALAKKVGKSREHIANTVRLNKLPQTIQTMILNQELSMGHARPLITLDKEADMIMWAKRIIKENLSVRVVEALLKKPQATPSKPKVTHHHYDKVTKSLEDKFQTHIKVSDNAITIHYKGWDDLNRILDLLDVNED
jgi:ParB family transcriptional regulator, chromosome partitioning protein